MAATPVPLGTLIDAVGAVSPRLGGSLAAALVVRTPSPRAVAPRDEWTMDAARRDTVRIPGIAHRGTDVRVYEWGRGDRVVALVHGWRGRASQFAPLVRELVAEDFRVVAFDAPGHGSSPGRRTYLLDWIDAIRALDDRHAGLHAVVGHSFGAAATLAAVSGGVRARRVVTAAAPAGTHRMFEHFRSVVGYSDRLDPALRDAFVRRHLGGDPHALDHLSAWRTPLPADVGLLAFHDEADPVVPVADLSRLIEANPQGFPVVTTGVGHSAVLRSDVFLDGALGFLSRPADAVPAVSEPSRP